jgi:16S rRNA (cytosine1402-N4)-methyltransferase
VEFKHTPVLLKEIVRYMPQTSRSFIDFTLGGAGHSLGILEQKPDIFLYAVDRDQEALEAASARLNAVSARYSLSHTSFGQASLELLSQGVKVDYIVADFGVSSHQIDQKERGFSFRFESPLDMRMDRRQDLTAATVVNSWEREELVKLIRTYGEEPFANRIVSKIIQRRAVEQIKTTWELADVVRTAIPKKFQFKELHPATKTFQALRIAVNQELEQIEMMLKNSLELLNFGGRVAIISFHSHEDRIVKKMFKNWEHPCSCSTKIPLCICGLKPQVKLLHRKVIVATEDELKQNTRSRSARLRVVEKI